MEESVKNDIVVSALSKKFVWSLELAYLSSLPSLFMRRVLPTLVVLCLSSLLSTLLPYLLMNLLRLLPVAVLLY